MPATGPPPNSSRMLSTGTPVPSLKQQLRSTANAARTQCKRHAGGASLNRRKPIVTRSSYACGIILRRVSFPNTRLYNVTGDHMDATAIILAAGEGTRMKSNHCKVSHKILGKPMSSGSSTLPSRPAAAASWSSSAATPRDARLIDAPTPTAPPRSSASSRPSAWAPATP